MVGGIRRDEYGRMRRRLPTGHLAAVAALCAFVQLAVACSGGSAGPLAHPSPAVRHQRAGPPGRPHLARQSSPPRADWAVPGSVIRDLDTASGSPYHHGEKVVALTFDDGPSPVYTPQILRVLAAARAPASFEIVGLHGAAYPGILRAQHAAGMALVNHTWTRADLALLPARLWPAEVDRTSGLLEGVTGHPVRCLRPPYGLGDRAVDARLRARGLAELGWDVDPSDYLRPGAGVIARRALAALHPGAVVIMHDGGGNRAQTVAALPAIIRGIRVAGYRIVPVCAD